MDWLFAFADPTIDWDYAMVTLLVRFIGVFFVMFAMQVALQISSRIIMWIETEPATVPMAVASSSPASATDDRMAAAIGLAIEGASEQEAAAIGVALAIEESSTAPGRKLR